MGPRGLFHRGLRVAVGWKKIAGWIGAGILASILLLQVGVVTLLHSGALPMTIFLRDLRRRRRVRPWGSDVQIRKLHRFTGQARASVSTAYGLVVYGAPPYAQPPVMEADRLRRLASPVVSLLRRSWYVNDLQVETSRVGASL